MIRNYFDKDRRISVILNDDGIKQINDSSSSMVFAFFKGKFVMSWHPTRKGWEIPAGRIETNETPEKCATREAFEETGAILNKLIPIGIFILDSNDKKSITALYKADIEKFEPKPDWSETGIVKLFDELPKELSYNDLIYENVLNYLKNP